VYPAEHAGLAGQISAQGAVVSELPPGVPPLAYHFPLRNRVISGLSSVVVVVEAAEKSGSLITAGYALNQGREVLAVPGTVAGGRNRGAHALIRDGAKIVESADDIVEELGTDLPCLAGQPTETSDGASMASGDIVARAMVPDLRYELEDLRARTGLETPVLLAHLADLELAGSVRRLAGGSFIRLVRTC
jgi:DNA processing protein